jgi:hypothetical protein
LEGKIIDRKVVALLTITVLICLPFLNVCNNNINFVKSITPSKEEIAYYWAPIWYQEVDEDNFIGDYITTFDYDGNWIGIDNWENLENSTYPAGIYYSVVETETHWFLGYYDFHSRDYTEVLVLQHENDLEGVLIVVKKEPEPWGEFLCMITETHGLLKPYTDQDSYPSNAVTNSHNTIDGDVEFEYINAYNISLPFSGHDHPIVYVDKWGHGVHGADRWEIDGFPSGYGITYKPLGLIGEPQEAVNCIVSYKLIDIQVFWDMRGGPYGEGYALGSFSTMDGDNFAEDAASLPWGWDDANDGPTFTGEIFYNPAHLVDTHLNGLGNFSHNYLFNPYAVQVTLDAYKVNWDLDGEHDNSDGFLNLYMIDGAGDYEYRNYRDGALDGNTGTQFNWIGWDMANGIWLDMHNQIPRSFYGILYPNKPWFGIRSKDWDEYTTDPWLMSKENTHWYGSKGTSRMEGLIVQEIDLGQNHLDWKGSELNLTVNLTTNAMLPQIHGSRTTWPYYVGGGGVVIFINFIIIRRRRKRKRLP